MGTIKTYIHKTAVILHAKSNMGIAQISYALVSPFYCCCFSRMLLRSHQIISSLYTELSTDINEVSRSHTLLCAAVQNYNITAQQAAKQISILQKWCFYFTFSFPGADYFLKFYISQASRLYISPNIKIFLESQIHAALNIFTQQN